MTKMDLTKDKANCCGNCVTFCFFDSPENIGTCNNEKSDHYNHVLQFQHEGCEYIQEKEDE